MWLLRSQWDGAAAAARGMWLLPQPVGGSGCHRSWRVGGAMPVHERVVLHIKQKKCIFLDNEHSALWAGFSNINAFLRGQPVVRWRHRYRV